MKRALIWVSLCLPAIALAYFWLLPESDTTHNLPLFHFYIVTFTTFAAAVIAILLSFALGESARMRHLLASVAFAEIAVLFFSHGVSTPNALIDFFHPAVSWSAWLTVLLGGVIFFAASFDTPNNPPKWLQSRWPIITLTVFTAVYLLMAAFVPEWLNFLEDQVDPWHRRVIFGATCFFWLLASVRFYLIWRETRNRVDGALAFVSFWLVSATISMFQFPLWNLSWWIYHFILLVGFMVTVYILISEYEQARKFSLIRYYIGVALIFTALLALIASDLYSRYTFNLLVSNLENDSVEMVQNLTEAITSTLPNSASEMETREEIIRGLSELSLGVLVVYDAEGLILFPKADAYANGDRTGLGSEEDFVGEIDSDGEKNFGVSEEARPYFERALGGERVVEVKDPDNPPVGYVPTERVHTIVAFIPIYPANTAENSRAIGVAQVIQPSPELTNSILASRNTGLFITALTMGILFAALLLVVRRADQILTTRTEELAAAYSDLRESEGMRDDLTSMIVHDMRNPLNAISASLSLVKTLGVLEEHADADRFVDLAASATTRMSGLTDDILAVSKYEAGEFIITLKESNISELARDRVNTFRPQVEKEEKTINVYTGSEIIADLDPQLIGRVIDNLISNAIKYVSRRSGVINVSVNLAGERITVQITDNGDGIPDAYKAKIFEKFVQAPDKLRYSLRKGTGLGLAFCKMVVDLHGGKIWVEDSPGGGSNFAFWIPSHQNN